MVLYVSLGVALVGVLVYGFSDNPKIAQVGLVAFAVGLLSFLLIVVGARQVTPF